MLQSQEKKFSFLAMQFFPEGIRSSDDQIIAVCNCLVLRDKDKVKSFLGPCTYYRSFVQRFVSITAFLYKFTKPRTPFEWTANCQTALKRLKAASSLSLILAYFKSKRQFIITAKFCQTQKKTIEQQGKSFSPSWSR